MYQTILFKNKKIHFKEQGNGKAIVLLPPLPHDCIVWFRNINNNLMFVNKNNNFYYI